MKPPRVPRSLALLIALGLVLGVGGDVTYAAFSSTTSNSGNNFSAAPDFVPPSASASVIAKTPGYLAGAINQGATYFVYANATDTGNPPSGISTITANVSGITTGQTALALTSTGGPFSVGGVSYTYRSASVVANNPLAAGSYAYTLTLTDAAANSQTQGGFNVTVDNTPPAGADVQTANGGATVGKAEANDTLTFTFTKQIDPNSILAGWTGASTTVTARITATNNFIVRDAGNTITLPLGTVTLNGSYGPGTQRNFTSSTMVQSGNAIVVTLGTPSGTTNTVTTPANMTWTPSATATDAAGNACSVATVTESGPLDVEF